MDLFAIVHEDDRWMVRDKDLHSMQKLGLQGIEQVVNQDDAVRMTRFLMHMDDGMSPGEAGRAVRRSFPTYYVDPASREFAEMEADQDAHLPFAVKKRLGILGLMKVKKNLTGAHTSFNACVRDLYRRGVLK